MSSDLLLDVRGLNAWYGAAHIIHDLDFSLPKGAVVALMGRNGAGKSTTLKSLMGLVPRRSGKVRFLDQDISGLEPYQIARRGLGFVPEDRRIFTELTVQDNLETGRQPMRCWPDGQPAVHWTTEKLLDLFPNLRTAQRRPASALSGGEQQMLTIARTLMGNPFVVLLDEPSEGVAPVIVEQMADLIVKLKHQGISIVLSEQNIHFARWVADYAYVLEKGVLRYSGSMEGLVANEQLRREYLAL